MTGVRQENKERLKIKLTDPGLIKLEKLMKKLDSLPHADTLRSSEKLNRMLEEQRQPGHEIIIKSNHIDGD